jgi:photosystem II stability/assembly factor-like uncharacterized protein
MIMKTRITLVVLALILLIVQGTVLPQIDPFYSYDVNKPQGEAVKEAVEYLDNYYAENYFSKGVKSTEMSGTGYYPYQRMKWFYEMRADENGEIPFLKRWNAYVESKNNLFKDNQVTVTANWINLGPTNNGGRMISHAFDPVNSEILWVGSAAGGLWRTMDGGDSWEPMTDYLPSIAVGAIAINPKDPNIMLIGTGEAYGWRFMVNGVGILKSTDRGLTWNQTSFTYQQSQGVTCYTIVWDPVNPGNVYAGCNNWLWRSTDMGESWLHVQPGRTTAILINKQEPNILYTSIHGSGLYKSTSAGESWSILGNGIPQGSFIGFTSMAICDAFPNVLYAGIARNDGSGKLLGFYRSNDAGENWTLLSTPDFYCWPPPNNICQGWYDNVTAVSPVDSNLVFANGINLYKSTDGGNLWQTPAGPLPNTSVHVDHHSFGFDPSNPAIVYTFNDGGVYKSTNGGESWIEKNDGLVTFQFYSIASAMTDTNIVSGGSQDNGTQFANNSNGNTAWSMWWWGDGMITNIDYTNSQIMYGEMQNGDHGKTINGGLTSYPINYGITESGPWITPVIMDPLDPKILYTASNTKIYKTTNRGGNWTSAANISNCKILGIDQINPDYVYASVWNYGSSVSVFWRSTDGGANWEEGTTPGWRVTDIEASPIKQGVLYATQNAFDGNPRVYKSLDYGDSWINITSNLPPVGTNAITINPYNTEHLYLATDLGVYVSLNDGGEWIEYNNNLPNVFTLDIHFHPVDTTVRAGTFGRGYWKTKAVDSNVTSIIGDGEVTIVSDFKLYQNYPNPFNPSTSIRFDLQNAGNVTGKIFNESGQEITELFSGYKKAGTHLAHWSGKNANGLKVSSGTYFYRLTVDRISHTIKMLLIK